MLIRRFDGTAWRPLPATGVVPPTHGRFRGPANTGIPAGTSLSMARRGGTHAANDETISDRVFGSVVTPTGARRVYQRCVFRAHAFDTYALTESLAPGGADAPLFIDCLIDGGLGKTAVLALNGGPGRFLRCEIRGGADLTRLAGGIVLEDCWSHTPTVQPGAHADLAQCIGGSFQVLRSRFDATPSEVNAPIQFGNFTSPLTSSLVHDSYFAGGNFGFNGSLAAYPGMVQFRRNRFGFSTYGAVASAVRNNGDWDATNVFDETGVPV